MPNNITNIITFTGKQEDVGKLLKILEVFDKEENKTYPIGFENIILVPAYIFQGSLGKEEREKYGIFNWYDWNIANWGTKWNAYSQSIKDNTIIFDTAWSSPTPVFDGLVKLIKDDGLDVEFEVVFADEDCGNNTGYYIYSKQNIDNGYFERNSNEAYEAYIKCKGKSDCLYQDELKNWNRYNCGDCPNPC